MTKKRIILIGSSTGGPKILREFFKETSEIDASIIIVQHMPKYINQTLTKSLDKLTDMKVKIAEDNEKIESGVVYIAPSEKHIVLKDNKRIFLKDGEKINFSKPSIDVLMKSVEPEKNREINGIILSGVGVDGVEGIVHLKKIGGETLVLKTDEKKSLVEMPDSAIKTGQIDKVLDINEIKEYIFGKTDIGKAKSSNDRKINNNLIVIGSSTGGPRILKRVFKEMPNINSPIILVQHMPLFMNDSLKKSIQMLTDMKVKIAEDNEIIKNGILYIAPSEVHLKVKNNMQIKLEKGEKVNYVCPSIDVTMESIKRYGNKNVIGVILTGMGKDGAKGLVHIKKIGGKTISQDKNSCVIYGMPRAAYETGYVDHVLNPEQIKEKIIKIAGIKK